MIFFLSSLPGSITHSFLRHWCRRLFQFFSEQLNPWLILIGMLLLYIVLGQSWTRWP